MAKQRKLGGRGHAIAGGVRQSLADDFVERYADGESIRRLASSAGLSYGFVHKVLTESGVRLRDRGQGGRNAQLTAALASRHPGQRLTLKQATATLRDVHGQCSWLNADRIKRAREKHNELVAETGPTAARVRAPRRRATKGGNRR